MTDLISRQAAIDALGKDPGYKVRLFGKSYDEGRSDQWFKDVYKLTTVPSAQPVKDIRAMCGECDAWNQYKNYPQPGWIPCTPETMPKNEEEVIVSILDDSGDNAFKYTASGWYWAAGDFWVVDNEMNRRVVAWMPLPKPYTGKDGDHHED